MLGRLLHLFLMVDIITSKPLSEPSEPKTKSSNDILPQMEFRTISHVWKTCDTNEVMNARGNCVPLVKVTSEVKLDLFALFGFQPDTSTSTTTKKPTFPEDMSSEISTTTESDELSVTEPHTDPHDSTDEVFDSTTEETLETTTEAEYFTDWSFDDYFFEARTLPSFII